MTKTKKLLAAIAIASLFVGCGQLDNDLKHAHSDWTGLDRKIILYAADGSVIKEWRTKAKVEDNGGTCFFIVKDKAVIISGTFIIEEQ